MTTNLQSPCSEIEAYKITYFQSAISQIKFHVLVPQQGHLQQYLSTIHQNPHQCQRDCTVQTSNPHGQSASSLGKDKHPNWQFCLCKNWVVEMAKFGYISPHFRRHVILQVFVVCICEQNTKVWTAKFEKAAPVVKSESHSTATGHPVITKCTEAELVTVSACLPN